MDSGYGNLSGAILDSREDEQQNRVQELVEKQPLAFPDLPDCAVGRNETEQFGIDIWMTTIAIARRFRICQAFLGSPKSHRAKDPAKDLGPMFTQVVSTLFDLMIDFEYLWKDTIETFPTSIYGFGLGVNEKPPMVRVNTDKDSAKKD